MASFYFLKKKIPTTPPPPPPPPTKKSIFAPGNLGLVRGICKNVPKLPQNFFHSILLFSIVILLLALLYNTI